MKMKGLLAIVLLVVSGVVGDAPYPPSGWRPSGPTLDLPQRGQNPQPDYLSPVDPRNNIPQKQTYLPPVDPRNPFPAQGSDIDVSVRGLPAQEQQPIFQLSPVNGQEYVGPNFNNDIRNLDQGLQQSQFQAQQEIYRQLARQRQLEATQAQGKNQPIPRQFVPRTTPSPTQSTTDDLKTTTENTTELNLNEGEVQSPSDQKKAKVTVEVSKQNIQEFPAELYLHPLAQLKLQPQYYQLGQISAPIYFQPGSEESQKQVAPGYDAQTHFSALASVLAQQKLLENQAQLIQYQPQVVQSQLQLQQPLVQPQSQLVQQSQLTQPQLVQPQSQYAQQQPQYAQPQPQYAQTQPQYAQTQPQYAQTQPQYAQTQPQYTQTQPQYLQSQLMQGQYPQQSFLVNGHQTNQYEPALNQYQPLNQYEPQAQTFPQFQAQPVVLQPQTNQLQPNEPKTEAEYDQNQPQYVYQQTYQPDIYQQGSQPQGNQYPQPQVLTQEQLNEYYRNYQNQLAQQGQVAPGQLVQGRFTQGQFGQQVFQGQGQDNLQSGLDANQQGNGIDQSKEQDGDDGDDGSTATAVATAFGTRTQPRVYSTYGAPVPVPRVQANPGYQTTTEPAAEAVTEDGPATAEATAVARGNGRKSAKLRSRRVRPVQFTLDRSGHLVLAQDQ